MALIGTWRNDATDPTDSSTPFSSGHQMLMADSCYVLDPRAGIWTVIIDLGVLSALRRSEAKLSVILDILLSFLLHPTLQQGICRILPLFATSTASTPAQHSFLSCLDHHRHLVPISLLLSQHSSQ